MNKGCAADGPDRNQFCETRREALQAYLGNKAFVSSSQLRRFARTGAPEASPYESEAPSATAMGEAFHSLVLEPLEFARSYLVMAHTGNAQRIESEHEAMRRHWLNAWQWTTLRNGRDALLRHRQAPVARWLAQGHKELSIYWGDEQNGRWKARPDCFTDDMVLDLKTTRDCRTDPFRRTREHYGYDLQAAHYVEAVSRLTGTTPRFAFLAIELEPPYPVRVHELTAHELAAARERLDSLRRSYLASLDSLARGG